MAEREIYITGHDLNRLSGFMRALGGENRDRSHFESLQGELDRARIVDARSVPEDVITMNSLARLRDLDTGEEMMYWLVFPDKADADRHAISVLAPIGTALLGYKEGDTIEWEVPRGIRRFLVLEVIYQPERLGNYEL